MFQQATQFTLGEAATGRKRIGLGLAALGRPGYINLGHADDLHHDYDKSAMEARRTGSLTRHGPAASAILTRPVRMGRRKSSSHRG